MTEPDTPDWRPRATLSDLRRRAQALVGLRRYLEDSGLWAVDTPTLSAFATPEWHIRNLRVPRPGGLSGDGFLQSSPEFAMKRLLAAGSGSLYQITQAFRGGEAGRWHNPEFTLAEWYRLDPDLDALMDDVRRAIDGARLQATPETPLPSIRTCTYQALFQEQFGIDPHRAEAAQLRELARAEGVGTGSLDEAIGPWLDLLMSHCVQPRMPSHQLTFVTGFPMSLAAFARADPAAPDRVRRFELFWGGLELANGCEEIVDPTEHRSRLANENDRRRRAGQPTVALDPRFVAAIEAGLPPCAGVALGVDRLIACLLGKTSLAEVLPFPADNA